MLNTYNNIITITIKHLEILNINLIFTHDI